MEKDMAKENIITKIRTIFIMETGSITSNREEEYTNAHNRSIMVIG